jgi:hypothetical protein
VVVIAPYIKQTPIPSGMFALNHLILESRNSWGIQSSATVWIAHHGTEVNQCLSRLSVERDFMPYPPWSGANTLFIV